MKLSLVYSVFNRSKLFERGLKSLTNQTFPAEEFEVIVVDDMSTEDIPALLKKFRRRLNIRYIRINHTKHPIWQEMNPTGAEENWYHTQAISGNIGLRKATGDVICLSQPEIIHAPDNLRTGYEAVLNGSKQVYGEIIMATQQFSDKLDWSNRLPSYDNLLEMVGKREYEFNHMPDHGHYETYWFIAFFPRLAALAIQGIDEEYLRGVYAEDDNFKARLRMAGYEEVFRGRPTLAGSTSNCVVGIHQSHLFEKELYKKQDRQSHFWDMGANTNRDRWRQWCASPTLMANEGKDWGSFDLVTEDRQL